MKTILVALLLASASSTAARASPCDDDSATAMGAVQAGYGQGDLGVLRRACPRTEVGVGAFGRAVVETANFYGNLRGGLKLDGSVAVGSRLELFAVVEALLFQQVISSFSASSLSLGDTSVGATIVAYQSGPLALSTTARAILPTAIGNYQNAFPLAFEAGLTGVAQPWAPLRLHAGFLAGTSFAVTAADPDPRGHLVGQAGVEVVPVDWFAFVVDGSAQALQRGGLDHVSAGFAARLALWSLGLDVGARVPLAGDERNLTTFQARTTWRF